MAESTEKDPRASRPRIVSVRIDRAKSAHQLTAQLYAIEISRQHRRRVLDLSSMNVNDHLAAAGDVIPKVDSIRRWGGSHCSSPRLLHSDDCQQRADAIISLPYAARQSNVCGAVPVSKSTEQRFDRATIRPSNDSTEQRFDRATIRPSKGSTEQGFDRARVRPSKVPIEQHRLHESKV